MHPRTGARHPSSNPCLAYSTCLCPDHTAHRCGCLGPDLQALQAALLMAGCRHLACQLVRLDRVMQTHGLMLHVAGGGTLILKNFKEGPPALEGIEMLAYLIMYMRILQAPPPQCTCVVLDHI